MVRAVTRVVVALGAFACLSAAVASAQQPTTTTQTKTFEVIAVEGNMLVVKLPEGTRELTVPEDFRFTVNGQPMSVHELKPGMSGTATITTKTTMVPVVVTEVKNGEVMDATGGSIIVKSEAGYKMFTQGELDKRGVKIYKNGQPAGISDFHKGDKLTATIVTTKAPKKMTEQQVEMALGGGAAPAAGTPAAAAAKPTTGKPAAAKPAAETAAPGAAPAAAPKKLPKTASSLPLLGLIGAALLAIGAALTVRRRVAR